MTAILAAATIAAWPNPGSAPGSAAAAAVLSPVRSGPPVAVWWHVGGQQLAEALIRDEEAMLSASRGSRLTALRSACVATRSDAVRVTGFAPVPDRAIEPVWSRAAMEFRLGAADCVTAISGASHQIATRSGAELSAGAKALDQAVSRILTVMRTRAKHRS